MKAKIWPLNSFIYCVGFQLASVVIFNIDFIIVIILMVVKVLLSGGWEIFFLHDNSER